MSADGDAGCAGERPQRLQRQAFALDQRDRVDAGLP